MLQQLLKTAGLGAVRDSDEVNSSVNELRSKDSSVSAEIKQNEGIISNKKDENEELQAETEGMQSELSSITQGNNVAPLDFSGSIIAQPMGLQ